MTNALNQYERATLANGNESASQKLTYDDDGNLTGAKMMADMNCDGSVNGYDTDAFELALSSCEDYSAQYPECDCMEADLNLDGSVNAYDIAPFVAILSGGGGARPVPLVQLVWDRENRLAEVRPLAGGELNGTKWVYAYDYLNRRIRKASYEWDTGTQNWKTTPEADVRYLYDGWNVVEELDARNSYAVIRKYTWGLDLAGQNGASAGGAGFQPANQGAAGIGGLLSVVNTAGPTSYYYTFDANGNVGQVVAASNGAFAAKYEYDPYGTRTTDPTNDTYTQPYRFSTRPFDDETGLGAWIRRVEDREVDGLGSNRHIIESTAIPGNSPVHRIDPYGDPATQPSDPTTAPSSDATTTQQANSCMIRWRREKLIWFGRTISHAGLDWHDGSGRGTIDYGYFHNDPALCGNNKRWPPLTTPGNPETFFPLRTQPHIAMPQSFCDCLKNDIPYQYGDCCDYSAFSIVGSNSNSALHAAIRHCEAKAGGRLQRPPWAGDWRLPGWDRRVAPLNPTNLAET